MRGVLILAVFILIGYAAVAFYLGFPGDCVVALLLAVLFHAGTHALEHRGRHWRIEDAREYRKWIEADTEARPCVCGEWFQVLPSAPTWMVCPDCSKELA